ncbi:hypothetical protein EV589_5072 [Mycobacterium sp. BK558]|nr:hypothetical protein EV589_5072 [Mycobacterium sp. BK558]
MRVPPSAALAVALLSLGVSAAALVRSFDHGVDYTDAQRAEATATICTAFATVRTGVATNTNVTPPGDVGGALAAAANARLALSDGGQYLLARLDPATPGDLAAEVTRFADALMDIGAASTAGVPNTDPAQAKRLEAAEAASAAVSNRCR